MTVARHLDAVAMTTAFSVLSYRQLPGYVRVSASYVVLSLCD